MRFGGIQRTSTIDFPGVLSCVLFTRGCNFDCFYCHNRQLLKSDGPEVSEKEVQYFLEQRRGLLDGVVVSGGEPTLQPDLADFLSFVRSLGYRIKLDTNGSHPDLVMALAEKGQLDYVAVDVKACSSDYESVCGVGSEGYENAKRLLLELDASPTAYEVRTTLYPGLSLDGLVLLLGSFPPLRAWRLNHFHMPEQMRDVDKQRLDTAALTAPALSRAADRLRERQPNLIF